MTTKPSEEQAAERAAAERAAAKRALRARARAENGMGVPATKPISADPIWPGNVRIFDSTSHVLRKVQVLDAFDTYRNGNGWLDGMEQEQAFEWSRVGCSAIVPAASELLGRFDEVIPTLGYEWGMDVAGYSPDIGDFLAGAPDCMRGMTFDPSRTGPLNIGVCLESGCRACANLNCLCSPVDAQSYKLKGAAILAFAMRMSAIRPVNLVALSCCTGHVKTEGTDFFYSERHSDRFQSVAIIGVRINTAPLDLASAGFVLCNVGYARAMLYGLHEKAQGATISEITGCDYPGLTFPLLVGDDGKRCNPTELNIPTHAKRYADGIRRELGWQDDDSIVIPPSQEVMRTAEDAIEWVKSNIARFTVQAE